MRVRVAADELAAALAGAARVAVGHGVMPTLAGVRIEAHDGGRLSVSATDLTVTVEVRREAAVETPGKVLVPARLMQALAQRLSGEVVLERDGTGVRVRAGRSEMALRGMDPDGQPQLPGGDWAGEVTLPGPTIRRMARVTHAASRDAYYRPILTAVGLSGADGRLRAVTTDGVRLAMDEAVVDLDGEAPALCVPARAMAEAARLLGADEAVSVRWTDTVVELAGASGAVRAVLIEGPYPDLLRYFEAEAPTTALVERAPLLAALRRAHVVAGRASAKPLVELRLEAGRLSVSASVADVGEAEEELAADVDGPAATVGLNVAYLIDAVEAMDAEEIGLAVAGPADPVRIEGAGDTLRAVIAPIVKPA